MEPIDRGWLARHPLPAVSQGGDKNARGCVLVAGGGAFVPGALRLTGEAALRAGAGKLSMATVEAAALPLAVLIPEASMIALPAGEDGEIAANAGAVLAGRWEHSDALVLGPGMSNGGQTERFVAHVLREAPARLTIVLDAGALTAATDLRDEIAARAGRVIMTPHHGEMSRLTGVDVDQVAADPAAIAARTAHAFNAVVALKGDRTVVVSPDGESALFSGGTEGLATSGSGDVLAGLVGGFAARGAAPFAAAGWGVFVHGTAGERASAEIAEIGFLARELLPRVPRLVAELTAHASG